jgi:polyisoprenoid-binding protein YceI
MTPSRTLVRATLVRAAALLAPLAAARAQGAGLPTRFNVDASHSSVGFAVRFMGMSTVRGAFGDVAGTVMYAEGRPERSSVRVVIGTASINTNSRGRDDHLRSPDFFDAARYPSIAFHSERVAAAPQGFVARGPLTMRGVTRPVEIPFVQLNPPQKDAWGNTRTTFQGALRLSRADYGIAGTAFWNSEFDPGRFAVADSIDVELLVSATVPNPLRWRHPLGDSLLAGVEGDGVGPALARFRATYAGTPRADSVPEFALVVAGEKLVAKGRVDDAVRFYEGVLDIVPHAAGARLRLAEAYLRQGRPEPARRELERVAREAPTDTAAPEWLRTLPPR